MNLCNALGDLLWPYCAKRVRNRYTEGGERHECRYSWEKGFRITPVGEGMAIAQKAF
jgi:hypothetical protein